MAVVFEGGSVDEDGAVFGVVAVVAVVVVSSAAESAEAKARMDW